MFGDFHQLGSSPICITSCVNPSSDVRSIEAPLAYVLQPVAQQLVTLAVAVSFKSDMSSSKVDEHHHPPQAGRHHQLCKYACFGGAQNRSSPNIRSTTVFDASVTPNMQLL
jgi:hypothetical protein